MHWHDLIIKKTEGVDDGIVLFFIIDDVIIVVDLRIGPWKAP